MKALWQNGLSWQRLKCFSDKELPQRGSCEEHNTTRWMLWQPCRMSHQTNRWLPNSLFISTTESIGLLAFASPNSKPRSQAFIVNSPKNCVYLYSLCTIQCKYTTVKKQSKILNILYAAWSVNFHLYFQFCFLKYYFHFNVFIYIMHIVMLSTFNPSLTVVSSRVVRVHNRLSLRFFRGARIVLDFFFCLWHTKKKAQFQFISNYQRHLMQKNQIWQFLSAKFYLVCLKK